MTAEELKDKQEVLESSSAATSPARGAVKCVAAGKKVTLKRCFASFPLRSLSSLERFCVRHGDLDAHFHRVPAEIDDGERHNKLPLT